MNQAASSRRKRAVCLIFVLSMVALPAQAVTMTVETNQDTVNTNGECSLREAIRNSENNNQNASTDCPAGAPDQMDTIVFDPSLNGGRIVLTFNPGFDGALKLGDENAGPVTIRGNGPEKTILDGNNASTVVDIFGFGTRNVITIENLTITNGFDTAGNRGGGIQLDGNVDFTIENVVLSNNSGDEGQFGGALSVEPFGGSTVRILRSKFLDNSAGDGRGGAIYMDIDQNTTVLIEGSVFRGNVARDATFATGGALYVDSIGGGSTLTIRRSEFSDNAAIATGDAQGEEIIASGGAIAFFPKGSNTNSNTPIRLTNVTISGNRAEAANGAARGGGVYQGDGTTQWINVTIARNSATAAAGERAVGGVYTDVFADAGFLIQNSIIAGNSGATAPDCFAADEPIRSISPGYNLLGSNKNCNFAAASQDIIGDVKSGEAPVDPRLADLAPNGNTLNATLTHALLENSPARDAGDPNVPGPDNTGTCAAVDQRGVDRPVDGDGDGGKACDIGAFEAAAGAAPPPDDGGGTGNQGNNSGGGGGCTLAENPVDPNPFFYFLLLIAVGGLVWRRRSVS